MQIHIVTTLESDEWEEYAHEKTLGAFSNFVEAQRFCDTQPENSPLYITTLTLDRPEDPPKCHDMHEAQQEIREAREELERLERKERERQVATARFVEQVKAGKVLGHRVDEAGRIVREK